MAYGPELSRNERAPPSRFLSLIFAPPIMTFGDFELFEVDRAVVRTLGHHSAAMFPKFGRPTGS